MPKTPEQLAKRKAYLEANKEKIAANAKAWKAANPEKCKAINERFLEKRLAIEPDYHRNIKLRQRARNRETYREIYARRVAWEGEGDVTREQMEKIVTECGGKCAYCGKDVSPIRCQKMKTRGFDHKIPRDRGGRHTATNMILCCLPCNRKKFTRTHDEFIEFLKTQNEQ